MSKGDFKKSTESIIPLRGVVRDGVLAALLDHQGNELGMPVTSQTNEVTGRTEISDAGRAALADSGFAPVGLRTVLYGDSFAVNASSNVLGSALTRANNVMTINSAGHKFGTGDKISIVNFQDPTINVIDAPVTYINANTYAVPSVGPDFSTAPALDSRGVTGANIISVPYYTAEGVIFHVQSLTKGALDIVHFGGAGSTDYRIHLEYLDARCLSFVPELVIYSSGTNEMRNGLLYADIVAGWDELIHKVLRAGARMLFIGPPAPISLWNTTCAKLQPKLIEWLRLKAQSTPGFYFCDTFPLTVDTANANKGQALATMVHSDNIHYSHRGAAAVGQKAVNTLPAVPKGDWLISSPMDVYAADSTSSNIYNGDVFSASGGVVWTVATDPVHGVNVTGVAQNGLDISAYAGTPTVVASCPAHAEGIGYVQRLVITPSAANDEVRIGMEASVTAGFSSGDKIEVAFELDLSEVTGSNLKGINAFLDNNGSAGNRQIYLCTVSDGLPAEYLQSDTKLTFVSEQINISPEYASNFSLRVRFIFAGAGSALTADLGRISFRKV